MRNIVQEGKSISFVNETDATIASGAGVVVGVLFGIVTDNVLAGAVGEAMLEGVYTLKKKTTDVVAKGVRLYWDADNEELTTTVGENTFAGWAFEAAGNTATSVALKIGLGGPQGPAGADGEDGAPGAAGADGADGAPGAAGADGADAVIVPAANVALLGETVDLVGVDGTADNAAPLVGTEARLDAIEAKVDAIITALIAAGLMAGAE